MNRDELDDLVDDWLPDTGIWFHWDDDSDELSEPFEGIAIRTGQSPWMLVLFTVIPNESVPEDVRTLDDYTLEVDFSREYDTSHELKSEVHSLTQSMCMGISRQIILQIIDELEDEYCSNDPYNQFNKHHYITITSYTSFSGSYDPQEDKTVREQTPMTRVSVPLVVRHHRATPGNEGLRVGKMCAGSLDLALNILNHLYPPGSDGEEPVRCRVNLASATAYRHYRAFCNEFLVPMDPDGGRIPVAVIWSWVANRRAHDQQS